MPGTRIKHPSHGPAKPPARRLQRKLHLLLRSLSSLETAKKQLAMALVAGVLLAAAFAIRLLHGPATARGALSAAAYVLAGWYTFQIALRMLREFRFDIDVLMFIAAAGAAANWRLRGRRSSPVPLRPGQQRRADCHGPGAKRHPRPRAAGTRDGDRSRCRRRRAASAGRATGARRPGRGAPVRSACRRRRRLLGSVG